MVVSIVLERNPELEFGDKVDLDGLVQEAFVDFQKDHSRLEATEKQVESLLPPRCPPLSHLISLYNQRVCIVTSVQEGIPIFQIVTRYPSQHARRPLISNITIVNGCNFIAI